MFTSESSEEEQASPGVLLIKLLSQHLMQQAATTVTTPAAIERIEQAVFDNAVKAATAHFMDWDGKRIAQLEMSARSRIIDRLQQQIEDRVTAIVKEEFAKLLPELEATVRAAAVEKLRAFIEKAKAGDIGQFTIDLRSLRSLVP